MYIYFIFDKGSLAGFLQTDLFYWIGLTDLAKEGTYVWQTNYEEANYTFWRTGQPDNGSGAEDCVHLVRSR